MSALGKLALVVFIGPFALVAWWLGAIVGTVISTTLRAYHEARENMS